jgi:hypothetical protein
MPHSLKNLLYVIKHPVEAFEEMKFKRFSSLPFAGVIVVLWFIVTVLNRQFTGFRFNENDPEDLNIFVTMLMTVVPYMLWCISNWAVCTLLDGEGRFDEICTYVAYAMVPYIVFLAIKTVLTNFMILEEGRFIQWFSAAGTIWTIFLIFQSMRIVHQYIVSKTIATNFFTIIGIAIIIFLVFLLFALFQQVYGFIKSVTDEILFRK